MIYGCVFVSEVAFIEGFGSVRFGVRVSVVNCELYRFGDGVFYDGFGLEF